MFELKPLKKPPVQNKPPAKVASAFKNAMNDDDDNKPATAARAKFSSFAAAIPQTNYQKILDETSKIVLEDPSIYSYDDHYDDIRDKRKELEQVKKQNVGSKYITNLKKAAEKRKVEQSIVHEKLAEKELQREGGPGTGEKYVTASYKRMMEENRKFQEEDAAKEAYNKEHAASIEDNTSGMYKDLYKQDIFMGGYRPDIATMIKQPQAQPQPEKKPEEVPQNKPQTQPQAQPQAEKRDIRSQEKSQERKPEQRAVPIEKEAKKERENSRERSRERSKSPSKLQGVREEQKEQQKEPEKELSKEEKLKLMKERYMQRKLNQSGAPGPANP